MSSLFDKFPVDALHVKVQAKSKKTGKGLAVLYVDARNVMDRLDEVVENENWSDEYHYIGYREVTNNKGEVIKMHDVECRLTVNGVTKADTGEGEDMKTAYSDAFKRAGVKFGIARYLYSSKTKWYELDDYGFFKAPDGEIIRELLGEYPQGRPAAGEIVQKQRSSSAGTEKSKPEPAPNSTISKAQQKQLTDYVTNGAVTPQQAKEILQSYGYRSSSDIQIKDFSAIKNELEQLPGQDNVSGDEMKAYADWEDRIPKTDKAKETFLEVSRKRFFAFMKEQGLEGEDAKEYAKKAVGALTMSTNDILIDPELRRKLNIKVYEETGKVLFS